MTAVTGGRWHRADLGLVGAVLILAALSALLLAGTDPSVAEVAWQSLVTPVAAIELLLDSDDAAAIGWWVIGGYSLMYAGTAALLAARGFPPQVKPLLPISPEHYYERQVLFTVPTGVGCAGDPRVLPRGAWRRAGPRAVLVPQRADRARTPVGGGVGCRGRAVPTTLPWWQAVMAGGAGATVTGITMPLVLR